MPAKTPIYLKTSTPSRGKKFKIRDVLSGDMISPPLGDLRHSAHVGLDGESDMFGDVEFLQGKLDMLPALTHSPNSHSQRTSRRMEELAYHRSHNSLHNSLLKTTFSMPVFIAPEQPPPKPPRLHLDEHSAPPQHPQHPQQRSMSVSEQGEGNHSDHTRGLSLSATIQILPHMVPSTGSLSEASSDESMSDSGGPLDPKRGLSLDSDTGLSNEDLRSEHCESPAFSTSVSRSESLMVLDLDLGPSILEDVLGIMDRYKSVEGRHEM